MFRRNPKTFTTTICSTPLFYHQIEKNTTRGRQNFSNYSEPKSVAMTVKNSQMVILIRLIANIAIWFRTEKPMKQQKSVKTNVVFGYCPPELQ